VLGDHDDASGASALFLIGLLPTYESAGYGADKRLSLRWMQGVGAGAEYGGFAVILAWSMHRGQAGPVRQLRGDGVNIGLLLHRRIRSLCLGWPKGRVSELGLEYPLSASIILILSASKYVRRLSETTVVQPDRSAQQAARSPAKGRVVKHPREFSGGAGRAPCRERSGLSLSGGSRGATEPSQWASQKSMVLKGIMLAYASRWSP